MVNNIVSYLGDEEVKKSTPLVIIGAAHNKGMIELLSEFGLKRCRF